MPDVAADSLTRGWCRCSHCSAFRAVRSRSRGFDRIVHSRTVGYSGSELLLAVIVHASTEPNTFVGYEQLLMPVSSLTDPTLENALDLLEAGFKRGGMLTLVGRCEVNYDGRAASHLPPGERLVITKPDRTLLVHRDEQRTPVNWQPPGCHHNACIKNDSLILQSTRTSPHEEVEISFETLAQVTLLELDDPPDLALEGSEEDLRQRIPANPDLLETGFQPLTTERGTTAGAVDICGKRCRRHTYHRRTQTPACGSQRSWPADSLR